MEKLLLLLIIAIPIVLLTILHQILIIKSLLLKYMDLVIIKGEIHKRSN